MPGLLNMLLSAPAVAPSSVPRLHKSSRSDIDAELSRSKVGGPEAPLIVFMVENLVFGLTA